MKDKIKWLFIGILATIALFLACGDEVMRRVDAGIDAAVQTCSSCPVSEPPLRGRIVHEFDTQEWGSNGAIAIARCGPDGILLGGKCAHGVENAGNATGMKYSRLREAGHCVDRVHEQDDKYCCSIGGAIPELDNSTGYVTAVAICLYPEGHITPPRVDAGAP